MSDLISVIIPVYNPGKHFKKCLDSITGQSYQCLEIILVDDGSTDGSAEICKRYAEKDERIVFISQKNAGVSAARNRGLEAATGAYISFIDSDDYLDLNAYELLLSELKKQAVDIVCYEYYATYADHERVHSFADKNRYGKKTRREAMREQVTGVPFLWTKFFTANLIRDLRFTVGLARGEDGEFAHKAIHRAQSVYYLDKPLLHYVQAEQSATRGKFRPSQLTFLSAYAESQSFFAKNYPELMQEVLASYIETSIMLYCDMYADSESYIREMSKTHHYFKEAYKKLDKNSLNKKRRVKFRFFALMPKAFAWVHTKRFKVAL